MPISLQTDTHPSPTDDGVTRRGRSISWLLLVLLPIPLTLLGVVLAAVGGWLGIGLVIAFQLSLLGTLVRTADYPPPSGPEPPTARAESPPVEEQLGWLDR